MVQSGDQCTKKTAGFRFYGLILERMGQISTAGAGNWFNPLINGPKCLPRSVLMVYSKKEWTKYQRQALKFGSILGLMDQNVCQDLF
ncbi:hypothetical protein D3H55_01410 [Bacillus salacetis]|uniref:Uncharacterized protein n=1 Tax=Bacillus salacetis TaxID=2315464 RepID=A0A3A1R982_9BACI|nr:hypothetical protein D3H55_01410 [Bacillus salacetis]